jgi:aspartyl-tRNA(Asn)/glutamyl-tRNA(Gln) amidotransferase subunit C
VPARISKEEVARIARLARLALGDDELERLVPELEEVLNYAAAVASLDTSGVAPTAHPLALHNIFREDEQEVGLEREEVLAQAPEARDGRFMVPQILGEL